MSNKILKVQHHVNTNTSILQALAINSLPTIDQLNPDNNEEDFTLIHFDKKLDLVDKNDLNLTKTVLQEVNNYVLFYKDQ
ncbi:unnamed protein product [Didymodactylos carnosus]|uniref:Uncharacterized protein n=1 Tax=Didymodactylos carnosus TaxID=1234261 RepID=A0A814MCR4_9BILA|nr:unnamed protein product [Didymodactylos carnosus]CAF1082084.1 unnamed protein product [Didymodactylos carnosus]CAF3843527.1 unnamed protein product [Didymodactylos carnosus]CAF3844894.1 unnamed protein product [Didymodactylos carnosus]